MPKVSKLRYLIEGKTQLFVFIPDPLLDGRWIKTDTSTILIDCPYCDAKKGEPCFSSFNGDKRYRSVVLTHIARRSLANSRINRYRLSKIKITNSKKFKKRG